MKIQTELSLFILFYFAKAKVLDTKTPIVYSLLEDSENGPSTTVIIETAESFEDVVDKPNKPKLEEQSVDAIEEDMKVNSKKRKHKKYKLNRLTEKKVIKALGMVSTILNRLREALDEQGEDNNNSDDYKIIENKVKIAPDLLRQRKNSKDISDVTENEEKRNWKNGDGLNLEELKSSIDRFLNENPGHGDEGSTESKNIIVNSQNNNVSASHTKPNIISSNIFKEEKADREQEETNLELSMRKMPDSEESDESDEKPGNNDMGLPIPENKPQTKSLSEGSETSGIQVGLRSFIGDLINARIYDLIEYGASIFKTFLTNLLSKLFNFGFGGTDMILFVGLAITIGITTGFVSGVLMLTGTGIIRMVSFQSVPKVIGDAITAPFRYLFHDILSIINDLNFGVIFKKLYNVMLNIYHRVVGNG